MQILPSGLGQSISESERSDRLILRHTRGRVTQTNHDVAYGSKNARLAMFALRPLIAQSQT